jgi:plastocyanin
VNRLRLGVICVGIVVMLGWTAAAVGSDDVQVNMKDDCDAATFNAVIGPGTCVGNGKTTFQDFVAQLQANGVIANRSAKGWKFAPGQMEIEAGQPFTVVNKGGETHSFSPVANYGGGCVAVLNGLLGGLTPVPECGAAGNQIPPATIVPAGHTLNVAGLSPGIHRFECLIHPWMRTTVVVENENDQGEDSNDD